MQIDRKSGHAPRTERVASEITSLRHGCVGCSDCKGLCQELIEAMMLPDLVLGRNK